ncbi:NUDIX domain-containing protein [Pseudooceanicola sp. CBS1P-1]|uniref:ADP-ribose pyrophosphatase n=1 Tax=Pseudooceanicola albus TaxID=2692189 RepID=A0A6L7G0B2_9RHOB|nr:MULTISPECIES: NUDIX domain-containing protein [Pseudooceanicola]MBT9383661.1 NUDIX domain-containing protein [Pseudooceanicola endophyticus]MXN17515.1 NUDIX domain-containing protein [Pseudooceanicola albus]
MSQNIFIYGTLLHVPLLGIVAGYAPPSENALLEGYRVAPSGRPNWPVLVQDPGRATRGLLLRDLSEDVVDRMVHYLGAYGYRLVPCTVQARGLPVAARRFTPEAASRVDPGEWDLTGWIGGPARADIHAAREVMALWGRFSGEDLKFRLGQIEARAHARVRAEDHPAPHRIATGPAAPQVSVLSRRDDHAGYFFTRSYELTHATFAGGPSEVIRRETFLAPDAGIVLLYDPTRDRVLLVEQFRMGPFARGEALPWMLEPVAGRVDPGETPEDCVRREAREEAGVEVRALFHIGSCYPTPGCSSEYYHVYLGTCDLPDAGQGQGGLDEEAEDIRTHVLSYEAAMELLTSGEAQAAPLFLTLMWLQAKRSELRGAA